MDLREAIDSSMTTEFDSKLIDPKELAAKFTVEQLGEKADELVRSMEDPTALLAKPVSSMREAPDLLSCFGMLLSGLAPLPGMTVLDFGAGSCWTSHFLTQLGCRVIAVDVSEAMLELGARRFEQQPPFGERPNPSFLVFDGHTLAVEDSSVDRIVCFDALHHVPNVREVVAEMGRVLRPGGIAGFSEPGPHHSEDPQSQHEMRRYGVPEFNLLLEEVWAYAQSSGFVDLSVAIFSPTPQWVPFETFSTFLNPTAGGQLKRLAGRTRGQLNAQIGRAARLVDELGTPAGARAALKQIAFTRGALANRRMFLMRKAGAEVVDSREVSGLAAEIHLEDVEVLSGPTTTTVRGVCKVRNTGRNVWLASSAGQGAVLLGLRVSHGAHPAADHGRVALPGDRLVPPGTAVVIPFTTDVATPKVGDEPVYLEVDLVSEGITWFATIQGAPLRIRIDPA
jgi:ubiquinone/menaquinone biosynthesis C-methylase UbiE